MGKILNRVKVKTLGGVNITIPNVDNLKIEQRKVKLDVSFRHKDLKSAARVLGKKER